MEETICIPGTYRLSLPLSKLLQSLQIQDRPLQPPEGVPPPPRTKLFPLIFASEKSAIIIIIIMPLRNIVSDNVTVVKFTYLAFEGDIQVSVVVCLVT